MKPIFRWAGSKRKLLPIIKEEMPKKFNRYIEPFCGSACLFFDLAEPKKSILSDINPELINAYKQIKRSPEKVSNHCSQIPINKETYYEIRSSLPKKDNVLDRAIKFTYLNRNCFNGVYRTNKAGKFNVPFGTRTGNLPDLERFIDVSLRLKSAELKCCDYKDIISIAKKGDFYYLDPPYSTRGAKSLGEYGSNSFTDADIEDLISSLKYLDSKGTMFILSFKNHPIIRAELESFTKIKELKVSRHVAGFSQYRTQAEEILVKNY